MGRPHQDHGCSGEVQAEAHRERHAVAAEGIAQHAEQAGAEGVEDLHHRRRQGHDGREVGRVVLGFVIDRLEPRRASALSFLVQVAAIAVLARAEGAAVIYGACAVYGFSVGNNITLSPTEKP